MPNLDELFQRVGAILEDRKKAENLQQERKHEERLRLFAHLDEEMHVWKRCPIVWASNLWVRSCTATAIQFTTRGAIYKWERDENRHQHSFAWTDDPAHGLSSGWTWNSISFEEWCAAAIAEMEWIIKEAKHEGNGIRAAMDYRKGCSA